MRIGIIGLQNGHHYHLLKGAKELGGCEIVAVSDADEGAVKAFINSQELAKDANPYTNWEHLLEHSMMDLCYVSDENGLRAQQLLPLLEKNIDIVAEKPLATTWEDYLRVADAMKKSKSHVTMMLTMRHDPKYATLRSLVQSGVVGRVRQVTAQKSYRLGVRPQWQKERSRLGGIIPYIGIHALDLIHWTTGLKFDQLAAFHSSGAVPAMQETEDSASILAALSDGATATVRLDYLRPQSAPTHGDDRLRIAGTEGILEVQGGDKDITLLKKGQPPERIKPEETDNLFASFIRAINSDQPPRITAADSLYATKIVLLARESADEKKLIDVPSSDG